MTLKWKIWRHGGMGEEIQPSGYRKTPYSWKRYYELSRGNWYFANSINLAVSFFFKEIDLIQYLYLVFCRQACSSHHQIVIGICFWFTICQTQPKHPQIVRRQCCLLSCWFMGTQKMTLHISVKCFFFIYFRNFLTCSCGWHEHTGRVDVVDSCHQQ